MQATRHKALLISPYFVPGQDGVDGFTAMVRERGAQVGVITNSLAANDVIAVHGAYARYRKPLLEGGVQLYEIRAQLAQASSLFGSSGASLHTKAFIIDDRHGFIGSFNIDPRSIDLNTEMGVLFDDPALAVALRDEYLHMAKPDISYWLYLENGKVRWLDRDHDPAFTLENEPDTTHWQRIQAKVIGWLPIESQL
jgi:putative cardiolipin synthase